MEKTNYPDITYPQVFNIQTIFMNFKKDPDYIKKFSLLRGGKDWVREHIQESQRA